MVQFRLRVEALDDPIRTTFGRRYYVLTGRGTTALWLALRSVTRRFSTGDVIVPDLLCSTVLDGILLAGCIPVFADVMPDRFTLSAESVKRLITPRTRAIIVTHLFGHSADIEAIRAAAPGLTVIEDAVQGFGGYYGHKPIGASGEFSFVSFDNTKMVGGRGGVLLFDDDSLLEGLDADVHQLQPPFDLTHEALYHLLPATAAKAYLSQLAHFAPKLLLPFDTSAANLEQIISDWQTLSERVRERNAKAAFLRDQLRGLPLFLPEIRDGDAIWRYTLVTPTVLMARRMIHAMQRANLSGSSLYYPLSRLFDQYTETSKLANRLINLWVDSATTEAALTRTVEVISALSR